MFEKQDIQTKPSYFYHNFIIFYHNAALSPLLAPFGQEGSRKNSHGYKPQRFPGLKILCSVLMLVKRRSRCILGTQILL